MGHTGCGQGRGDLGLQPLGGAVEVGVRRVVGQLERDLRAGGSDVNLNPSAYAALAEVVTAERFPTLAPVFWAGAYTGDPAADPDASVADDFDLGKYMDGRS